MQYRIVVALASFLLSSCAQIDAIPLNSDGTEAASKANGIRYYLPKPYLLVMALPQTAPAGNKTTSGSVDALHAGQMPSDSGQAGGSASGGSGSGSGGSGGSGANAGTNGSGNGNGTPAQTGVSGASSADISFLAATPQYTAKIIYLPDMDQPMALEVSAGLFGTTTFSPTLQDGWMLSSLNGSVDSGGANAVQLLESVASSAVGASKTAATGGTLHAGAIASGSQGGSSPVLPPGLYQFDKTRGLVPVTYFCSAGPAQFPGTCSQAPQAGQQAPQQLSNQSQVIPPDQSGPQH